MCVLFAFLCWQETYTEIAGMQRFGAFYMDYLYTMENISGKGTSFFPLHLLFFEQEKQKTLQNQLVLDWLSSITSDLPSVTLGNGLILISC